MMIHPGGGMAMSPNQAMMGMNMGGPHPGMRMGMGMNMGGQQPGMGMGMGMGMVQQQPKQDAFADFGNFGK
ncbi:hypothetical protein NHX12_011340 [Muraenolepis orangiensis]|uniref:Uncharacterized protein n=1 Tax=Muraenolepis orangiensis TaxID=630683 RepID=A0A9Q0I7J3_9TELE|nr:hypothetical protein NHX12_011340 [Muraenolepis orangiensis]